MNVNEVAANLWKRSPFLVNFVVFFDYMDFEGDSWLGRNNTISPRHLVSLLKRICVMTDVIRELGI